MNLATLCYNFIQRRLQWVGVPMVVLPVRANV
jgi:hypothetical protein